MRAREEEAIQSAIVSYLRLALPNHLVFAIPNGGLRSKREAARMVGLGVLAGVADLQVIGPMPGRSHTELNFHVHGVSCFIEVKTAKGKLTAAQEAFRDHCRRCFIPWACCRSVEEAHTALVSWGLNPRCEP
jgi:hypothetical protein